MASVKLPLARALFFAAQRAAEEYWGGHDLDSQIIREQALNGATPTDRRLFDSFFVERIRVLLSQEGGLKTGRAVRLVFRLGPPR